MSWRPEADAISNWETQIETESGTLTPQRWTGGVSPPGCPHLAGLTPLTPVSHNLPAIIIPPLYAPWLVKVDNSLKTKQEMLYIETWAFECMRISSTCLRSLQSARVLITVVAVLIPGPALQSSAHCLIRANLLERQYLGYGPIFRISICPWQALTGNIFIRR